MKKETVQLKYKKKQNQYDFKLQKKISMNPSLDIPLNGNYFPFLKNKSQGNSMTFH